MNTLDIIILIPLAYFAYKGFAKGFIITLAMLAGLLLGLYAAINFSEYSVTLLKDQLHMESANIRMIAYLFTFVVVLVLVYLLGHFLTGVVKTTGLGIVNRIAGLLLGVLKGLMIISVLIVLFGKIDPKSYLIPEKSKTESVLYKPVATISEQVFPVLQKYTQKAKELLMGEEGKKK
jgi:membrane protein required for colicin V production